MADFKSIRDTVMVSLATAAGKTKDLADKAVDKAKDVSRVAKLNMELGTEKSIIEKAYAEIGKLYYETRKDNPDGFFIQLCDEIALAKENIANIQAEIESIKVGEDDSCCDDSCCCESVEVEFTVVPDAEPEKAEAPKSESDGGCSCGCSHHAEGSAEGPKE